MKQVVKTVKVIRDGADYLFCAETDQPLRMRLSYQGAAGLVSREIILPYRLDSYDGNSQHPVFTLTDQSSGVTFKTAMRTLPVSGTQNLRDLGGYTGDSGRQVKYGMLYRSDQLAKVAGAGEAYLKNLGIKTVIDLRSLPEARKSPNVDFGALKILRCDPSAETAELAASFQASAADEDRLLVDNVRQKLAGNQPEDGMALQYRKFATHPPCIAAFGRMMKEICDPESAPLIFHCRGGKDRTGFAAMLILGALGVSEADIIADYLVTRDNRAARTEIKMEQYKTYTDDPAVLSYLYTLLDTTPDYMQTSINEIKKQYDTIENYLKAVLGLTASQLEIMKNTYLY